ncbi:hypothetical protein [Stappia indica]|uniref:hypothetical protein n=1 Tax=Stappia indica TaxID=538381 RepID=UPI000832AC64|nr:hypothetical protein [Stappia indica]
MSDLDLSRYRRHVDHLDLPDEKKDEMLRVLWTIAQSFVDRAFGLDPVQQVSGSLSGPAEHASVPALPPVGDGPEAKDAIDSRPVIGSIATTTTTETDKKDLTGSFRTTSGSAGGRK